MPHSERRYSVLSVAYPLLPVHSGSAGGAEQILSLVDRGVTEAGHDSLVIAAAGSRIVGTLIQTQTFEGQITEEMLARAREEHRDFIERTLRETRVDLIHLHGLDFYEYLPSTSVPKVATLHLPIAWYPDHIFEIPGLELVCVSDAQATTLPERQRATTVRNGIDVAAFGGGCERGDFLLYLGRICPEKGADIALRIAHQLARRLVLAGPVHPFEYHQNYFREKVAPLLDDERRYVGATGLLEKRKLLAQTQCLLIPSLVDETSSLVAMEAMASGTPVIAFRRGALPEVVEHERTGFLVENEGEMADAVEKTATISAAVCRETALRRFDFRRMVDDYLGLYERVLGGWLKRPASQAPAVVSK
ncbi:MAG: glycosyltransferase family 4 protein [Acidobacteriaceae bacterium]|nr:glycosyltransferase family 4 protein [Acidobacteriaceae bacterium]